MNPYEPPKSVNDAKKLAISKDGTIAGLPCRSCGSINTTTDFVLRAKPNLVWAVAFGWLFLWVRGAFAMRSWFCRDCGATSRYKSVGSWIALVLLVMLVALMAITYS
jgi:hypothetical protein